MTTMHFKACPRCGKPAPPEAPHCSDCGRVYQSAPPAKQLPQAAPQRSHPYWLYGLLVAGSLVCVSVVGCFDLLNTAAANLKPVSPPPAHTTLAPPEPAETSIAPAASGAPYPSVAAPRPISAPAAQAQQPLISEQSSVSPPASSQAEDRYLNWLAGMDQERHQLSRSGKELRDAAIQVQLEHMTKYSLVEDPARLAQADAELAQRLEPINNRIRQASEAFRTRVLQTRPAVPARCQSLDSHMMSALDAETAAIRSHRSIVPDNEIASIRANNEQMSREIARHLAAANSELGRICQERGIPQPFQIVPVGP